MPNWEIYLAVTVPCTPECSEALASFLFDLDATGVVENNGSLTASFKGVRHEVLSPIRNFVAALQSMGHPVQPEAVFSEEIENRDWNAEWKKGYTGFKISARIYIKPTWEAPPARPYPCLIAIDPEMAFGTGTHATTRLCLRMLDHHLQPGARVLDIGTGTGILAIAAARLGAGAIVAFDVDPVAAETARRNAAANGVHTGLEIFAGELADLPPLPFDLVLANIQRNVIVGMLPVLRQRFSSGTDFIFSGILREEETFFRDALTTHHFACIEMQYDEEWLGCLAR
ncbi:MAG TPA: 50S ribosomal protein L11 methyltransferase [bacterium]|nr:50S ribosomal protein L11 methyltransferase [bacterium]HQG44104.1 50S ribosomal protein L11 methyltransferase [bacterium]HQI49033.1 50S ribosomal protein L11 methyltransferase [bacterium]HQJ65071.1 50S ribosomal protein L11 methyltransferase [bacterium]